MSKFSPQKRGSDVAGASGSREAPAAASAPEPPRPALKRTLARSMGRTLTRSMSVVLAETREPLSRAISLRHSHGAQLLERMAGLGGDADEEAGAS